MRYYTKPPIGTPLNLAHPLNRGLVGYWPLGEGAGSKTQDISGKGNHGTLTGIVQGATSGWTGGKFGRALNFDGTDDRISAPVIPLTGGSFSISGWGKTNVTTGTSIMFYAQGNTGDNDPIISIQMHSGTSFEIVNRNDTAVGLLATVTFNYIINTWYHIVWTCSTTESRLYVNGVLIDTRTFTANSGTFNTSYIGSRQRISSEAFTNGTIEEVRIHNRALSALEVQKLYTDPFCMFEQKSAFSWFVPTVSAGGGSFFFAR